MIEHRLIERMIRLMKREVGLISGTGVVRPGFIDRAVDFIRSYAARCHHGKEEDILFGQLSQRAMNDEHRLTMEELIEDHVRARKMTALLAGAKQHYLAGEGGAFDEIVAVMRELVDFYPLHIEKEDRRFFIPSMAYFSTHEQDEMLESFWEFDRLVIHEKYRSLVERCEREHPADSP
jgi:hemerythrin-like domain-containing protein